MRCYRMDRKFDYIMLKEVKIKIGYAPYHRYPILTVYHRNRVPNPFLHAPHRVRGLDGKLYELA